MKKTLGGDRLGSGKKQQVELHNYERSTHDLGYIWRSTMAAGTLVPFMSEIALPGDTFDINLDVDIKTHPTIGPLFGSYKIQLDIFQAPIRLYNSLLHNNALGIGLNMAQVKLPVLNLTAPQTPNPAPDLDNLQINPSCILNYLGIRGIGVNPETSAKERKFNATSFIAYWDIYKNYYANKQEEIGAVIHTPALALVETVTDIQVAPPPYDVETALPEAPLITPISLVAGSRIRVNYSAATPPLPNQIMVNTTEHGQVSLQQLCGAFTDDGIDQLIGYFNQAAWGTTTLQSWQYIANDNINNGRPAVATFPLENIDELRRAILAFSSFTTAFAIDTNYSQPPYSWIVEVANDIPNVLSNQEGLGLKTYQSDLFNNWLQTEWIDGTNGISEVTAIDTSGGSFTIDTLNLSKKVYEMLNRIAVSGGTYDDWLDAVYTHDRYVKAETPMYMGGLIRELIFQEVVSNAESEGQPLGTLAGKGVMGQKRKGGNITVKVDEPSYIIGIISLTPRVDYSQGNKWDVGLQTLNDLHKPALDEIGFQDLITEQMGWWTTVWDEATDVWIQKSAGKQPAWTNYMTNVNKTFGNFAIANNEMFMTLNRRYEGDESGSIVDLTTYIDPSKFNFIFAETALDAQNFWAQIAVDITARRKMSAKVMPNL